MKKILIIDYDVRSLHDLSELFSTHDVEIIQASDGEVGYESFTRESPDLVLMEAMLPKLHGFDLAKKINEETQGAVPVVIVTGLYKGQKYKNEALRSFGVTEYFEKPFDKEKLVSTVFSLIQEDVDIDEDLPDSASVIKALEARLKKE